MAVKKLRRTRVSRKNKIKILKINDKQHTKIKIDSKKALVIAQEVKFARLLANNDKKVRDKVLKNLKKWLTVRSQSSFAFVETDFMSLWKGLFYCMWMSDKPLVQEDLAESLSKVVHCFNSKDIIVLYTTCALKTLATEWFGIDQYRLDKFSMLVRRILRQTFVVCKDRSWDIEWVTEISQIFEKLLIYPKTSLGFSMYITEIYLEELAKISEGNLPEGIIDEFIKPYILCLITTKDERIMKHIKRHIFKYLIFQSNIGLDYTEKFEAWRNAGFPCTHIDDMQEVEISDTEENFKDEDKQFSKAEIQDEIEKPLDLRAGRINVELPQISFNAARIVQLFSQYKFHPSSTTRSRRHLSRLLGQFKELSEGRMPLGVKKVIKTNRQKKDMDSKKAAHHFIQFEKNLFSDSSKANKKRKKNNQQLIKNDTCASSIDNLENGNISKMELNQDEEETINLQNNSTNMAVTIKNKNNLKNIDANIIPLKKRKKNNLICNQLGNKYKIAENKEKLEKKVLCKKNNKIKTIKLKHNTQIADKRIEHKTKKMALNEWQVSDNIDPQTTPVLTFQNSVLLKETNNSVTEKAVLKDDITQDQVTPLKKKSINQEQTYLNDSSAGKKKVKIMLHRNTAQHTSEYIRQVRNSPGIPFDANKKPIVGVLKASAIPSPVNPFYKKGLRN